MYIEITHTLADCIKLWSQVERLIHLLISSGLNTKEKMMSKGHPVPSCPGWGHMQSITDSHTHKDIRT